MVFLYQKTSGGSHDSPVEPTLQWKYYGIPMDRWYGKPMAEVPKERLLDYLKNGSSEKERKRVEAFLKAGVVLEQKLCEESLL